MYFYTFFSVLIIMMKKGWEQLRCIDTKRSEFTSYPSFGMIVADTIENPSTD
jgi:hypothetical protein